MLMQKKSYYFKSIFTNVPLEEVVEICVDTLYKISKPTINRLYFKELSKLAIYCVKFTFNSLIYSQHDGIAMGTPLGPKLANIFIGYTELKVFKNNLLYLRYVDDFFCVGHKRENCG